MSLSNTGTASRPSDNGNAPLDSENHECPVPEYLLADFVEVVTQDDDKWVKGATETPNDTSIFNGAFERTDKDKNKNFKQYINLERDCEQQTHRHPEYGRKITFKARIERKDKESEALGGKSILFQYECKKAKNRESPDETIWQEADEAAGYHLGDLTGGQKEGFGSMNGDLTTTAVTGDDGWTGEISFYTSQYGGDQYIISAELDPSVTPVSDGYAAMKTKKYVVWRKFWYQMTYADGFSAKQPSKAEKVYEEVFAEMTPSPNQTFKRDDLPDDLKDTTFLEEYQVEAGGQNKVVAVIGGHNKDKFTQDPYYTVDDPAGTYLKANLIVCEHQCDPEGDSPVHLHELKANGDTVTIDTGDVGSIICKPGLEPNSDLVVAGEWSKNPDPNQWETGGDIPDDCIEIYKNRSYTCQIKVDLSKGATSADGTPVPVPSAETPVWIELTVQTAEGYLGESFGTGQILCVYRPNASNFLHREGNKQDFNNTVAHELAHMWKQSPEKDLQNPSLKNHPLHYMEHGGQGPHCRHGMTKLLDENETNTLSVDTVTKIKQTADAPTDEHRVKSTKNFKPGHKVSVQGQERTIASIVDGSHLKFTESFAAQKGDKVEQKMTDYSPVDWTDDTQDEPVPQDGDCIMYHAFSKKCKNKFCKICNVHLQLQEMSSLTTG